MFSLYPFVSIVSFVVNHAVGLASLLWTNRKTSNRRADAFPVKLE